MARPRKKKRTHVKPLDRNSAIDAPARNEGPRSMVIRIGAGDVGSSVSQLAQDIRDVLEPNTASRLKERRSNRLKDYAAMAGPLGISHLLLFSRSKSGNTNLRLAVSPRGPTLSFRVLKYSLTKDVKRSQKRPRGRDNDFLAPPLLVLNNFTSPTPAPETQNVVPQHLETLTTSIFQSLFPSISPQYTPVSSIKRVLLLNRETLATQRSKESGPYKITLRHYAVTSKPSNVSRIVRRLGRRRTPARRDDKSSSSLPNLGRLDDVANYVDTMSDDISGFTSGSESEVVSDEEVEMKPTTTHRLLNPRQQKRFSKNGDAPTASSSPPSEKRVIKLVEIGPRLQLRLTKVEEGMCEGKVMWHEYITKSTDEERRTDEVWLKRREEKEQRRRTQLENINKKKKNTDLKTSNKQTNLSSIDLDGAAQDASHSASDFTDTDGADGEEDYLI